METPASSQKTPKVSVIIPAYNQAAYIRESVDSVLGQTLTDFELVVVDDGSTDQTPQILSEFRDSRLHVIRQVNGGLSAARNTGIRASTAPLITLLDSDDYFFPEKLALLTGFLERNPEIGMVSGETLLVDQKSQPIRPAKKSQIRLDLPGLLLGNPFTPSAVMFRREWIERAGVFDESLRACEDWDLWLRMAYTGCQFAWVEQTVVAYRFHSGQMTRESERMRTALMTVLNKFFNQPELPASIRVQRDTAYASALVTAAAYAYHAQSFPQGQQDLNAAARLDPRLRENHYHRLTGALVGWSEDPRSDDPVAYLQRIIANPPQGLPGFTFWLRRAIADVLLSRLFNNSPQQWRAQRKELTQAVIYKPDWLFNRGVLRMLAESWKLN